MKTFNNFHGSTFYSDVYLFDEISLHLNFQRLYFVGEHLFYYMRFLTYICD